MTETFQFTSIKSSNQGMNKISRSTCHRNIHAPGGHAHPEIPDPRGTAWLVPTSASQASLLQIPQPATDSCQDPDSEQTGEQREPVMWGKKTEQGLGCRRKQVPHAAAWTQKVGCDVAALTSRPRGGSCSAPHFQPQNRGSQQTRCSGTASAPG